MSSVRPRRISLWVDVCLGCDAGAVVDLLPFVGPQPLDGLASVMRMFRRKVPERRWGASEGSVDEAWPSLLLAPFLAFRASCVV